MEIFRQLAIISIRAKELFIFKKKRIDTIFISFHLSIVRVVLLSRCNKYIYIYNSVIHDRDRFSMRPEISSDIRVIFYFTGYLLG